MTEAWTGPQVAWKMARGLHGSFGGKTLQAWYVWVGFCVLFFAGLADWRRPLSMRNLDLLVLLSFSVSLLFFNLGQIFVSVPLVYPSWATCSFAACGSGCAGASGRRGSPGRRGRSRPPPCSCSGSASG